MARLGHSPITLGEKVLIYGDPKTGKTLLAGELSKNWKLKWIDVENGSSTLLQLPAKQQLNIEVAQIPDTPKKPYAIEALLMIFDGRKGYVCDDHGKWNCMKCRTSSAVTHFDINNYDPNEILVIDSFTQVSDSAMNRIALNANLNFIDGDKFEYDHWGMLGQLLSRLLISIQNSQCNVVVISHESEVEQTNGMDKLTAAGGTKNFGKKIPKYFGHVVRMSMVNGKHKAISATVQDKTAITGSRLNIDLAAEEAELDDIFSYAKKNAAKIAKIASEEIPQEIKDTAIDVVSEVVEGVESLSDDGAKTKPPTAAQRMLAARAKRAAGLA